MNGYTTRTRPLGLNLALLLQAVCLMTGFGYGQQIVFSCEMGAYEYSLSNNSSSSSGQQNNSFINKSNNLIINTWPLLECYLDAINGDDANVGNNFELPKQTLHAALDMMDGTGVLFVLPGVYELNEILWQMPWIECLDEEDQIFLIIPNGLEVDGFTGFTIIRQ